MWFLSKLHYLKLIFTHFIKFVLLPEDVGKNWSLNIFNHSNLLLYFCFNLKNNKFSIKYRHSTNHNSDENLTHNFLQFIEHTVTVCPGAISTEILANRSHEVIISQRSMHDSMHIPKRTSNSQRSYMRRSSIHPIS